MNIWRKERQKIIYEEDLNKPQEKTTLPFNKTLQVHVLLFLKLHQKLETASCVPFIF